MRKSTSSKFSVDLRRTRQKLVQDLICHIGKIRPEGAVYNEVYDRLGSKLVYEPVATTDDKKVDRIFLRLVEKFHARSELSRAKSIELAVARFRKTKFDAGTGQALEFHASVLLTLHLLSDPSPVIGVIGPTPSRVRAEFGVREGQRYLRAALRRNEISEPVATVGEGGGPAPFVRDGFPERTSAILEGLVDYASSEEESEFEEDQSIDRNPLDVEAGYDDNYLEWLDENYSSSSDEEEEEEEQDGRAREGSDDEHKKSELKDPGKAAAPAPASAQKELAAERDRFAERNKHIYVARIAQKSAVAEGSSLRHKLGEALAARAKRSSGARGRAWQLGPAFVSEAEAVSDVLAALGGLQGEMVSLAEQEEEEERETGGDGAGVRRTTRYVATLAKGSVGHLSPLGMRNLLERFVGVANSLRRLRMFCDYVPPVVAPPSSSGAEKPPGAAPELSCVLEAFMASAGALVRRMTFRLLELRAKHIACEKSRLLSKDSSELTLLQLWEMLTPLRAQVACLEHVVSARPWQALPPPLQAGLLLSELYAQAERLLLASARLEGPALTTLQMFLAASFSYVRQLDRFVADAYVNDPRAEFYVERAAAAAAPAERGAGQSGHLWSKLVQLRSVDLTTSLPAGSAASASPLSQADQVPVFLQSMSKVILEAGASTMIRRGLSGTELARVAADDAQKGSLFDEFIGGLEAVLRAACRRGTQEGPARGGGGANGGAGVPDAGAGGGAVQEALGAEDAPAAAAPHTPRAATFGDMLQQAESASKSSSSAAAADGAAQAAEFGDLFSPSEPAFVSAFVADSLFVGPALESEMDAEEEDEAEEEAADKEDTAAPGGKASETRPTAVLSEAHGWGVPLTPFPVIVHRTLVGPLQRRVAAQTSALVTHLVDSGILENTFACLKAVFFFGAGDSMFDFVRELYTPGLSRLIVRSEAALSALLHERLAAGVTLTRKQQQLVEKRMTVALLDFRAAGRGGGRMRPASVQAAEAEAAAGAEPAEQKKEKQKQPPASAGRLFLDFRPEWPLELIMPRPSIAVYNRLFSFLLLIKRLKFMLEDVGHAPIQAAFDLLMGNAVHRHTLQQLSATVAAGDPGAGPRRFSRENMLNQLFPMRIIALRSRLLFFTNALEMFLLERCLYPEFEAAAAAIKKATSLEEGSLLHSNVLKRMLKRCLLDAKGEVVRAPILKTVALAQDFRAVVDKYCTVSADTDMRTLDSISLEILKIEGVLEAQSRLLVVLLENLTRRRPKSHLDDLLVRLNFNGFFGKKGVS